VFRCVSDCRRGWPRFEARGHAGADRTALLSRLHDRQGLREQLHRAQPNLPAAAGLRV
jgi:hypothetical protein